MKNILRQKTTIFALIIFGLFTCVWIYLRLIVEATYIQREIIGATYGIMALYGGIVGLFVSKKWGGFKSYLGKAIIMLSLGLLAQEFGQIAYTVLGQLLPKGDIPYPSIGDIGYMGSVVLYIYGVWMLAKTAGIHISIKSLASKIQVVLIPGLILSASYIAFLSHYQFDWSKPLVIFLDFGYPLGQSVYIAIAILVFTLSRRLLGGLMKPVIWFLIIALGVQYMADYMFLYTHAKGTWKAAGLNDYTYFVAYFMMTLSLIAFNQIKIGNSTKTEETNV